VHELLHGIYIQAHPEKVYQAITTADGLRQWWTADCVVEPRVGSVAEFGFFGRKAVFRMRIDELVPSQRVVWQCVGGPDEWPGTRLTWDLSEDAGKTRVRFQQTGWPHIEGHFRPANSTWGALMYRLKDYAEGKSPGPHFK
jgi:uncharacterized protein YndB with AHSA1/START domain